MSASFLSENIKNVYRGINCCKKFGEAYYRWQLEIRPVKIFEPTIANIFSRTGIINSCGPDFNDELKMRLIEEGNQYQYYALSENIGDGPISNCSQMGMYDCLARRSLIGEAAVYSLSSPAMGSVSDFAWIVNVSYAIRDDTNTQRGVAPCFCI